jgi:hypothetical protein
MVVRLASEKAPDRPVNEDHGFADAGLVGVLDGVTAFDGVDTGCEHSPAWYVQRLSAHLVSRHGQSPETPLPQLLAESISDTRNDHGGRCDLDHRGTPASTVCLLKDRGDHIEYLVLADSPLVLDRDEVQVVTDDRFEAAIATLRETVLTGKDTLDSAGHAERVRYTVTRRQQLINTAEGYWIAAANPAAAYEAVTGTAPLRGPDRVRRAALLTDGASAAVELFALVDWRSLLDVLTKDGPRELIRQVRVAENADHDGHERPRYKRYDDATAAICTFEEEAE